MSSPHPTISAWERDLHAGHYQTELHGWKLTTSWTPNTPTTRGNFVWLAERDGEKAHHGHHGFEEMELAMADAEAFARNDAAVRTAEIERAIA